MKSFIKIKQKNETCPSKPWRSRGFTLVETLVAISIFSMSIIALMSILGGGISNTNYAKMKISASYLAQEGIEYVKNMRDTSALYGGASGWNDFIAADKSYPSAYPDFTRTIQMTAINSDEVRISSTVSWTQASGSSSITFFDYFFNWVEI